jgi:excisionase family DNA binding protein
LSLPDLVPVSLAAEYLGCSIATVNRRIRSGALRAVDISSPGAGQPTRRIPRDSLEALLKPIERKPAANPFAAALAELVAAAPRLTDEQAARIGDILRGGGEGDA